MLTTKLECPLKAIRTKPKAYWIKWVFIFMSVCQWFGILGVQILDCHTKDKKWYLMPPCFTLSIIRYGSRVMCSNPRNGVPPPAPQYSSYWKGSLPVAKFTYFLSHCKQNRLARRIISSLHLACLLCTFYIWPPLIITIHILYICKMGSVSMKLLAKKFPVSNEI